MIQGESRPNILWICTDQQRYDTISALGYSHVSTPNLDQLAAEGVAFERAYCQAPICTPSRASFLTGMYPSSIHVNRNGNPTFPGFPPLISKRLADAGYTCGLIGKLHLTSAYGRVEARTDDAYSYWQYSHAPRADWERGHDYADWVRSKGADLAELTADPAGVPAELHQTTWCAEKTIEFIEANRARPWFASVNITIRIRHLIRRKPIATCLIRARSSRPSFAKATWRSKANWRPSIFSRKRGGPMTWTSKARFCRNLQRAPTLSRKQPASETREP